MFIEKGLVDDDLGYSLKVKKKSAVSNHFNENSLVLIEKIASKKGLSVSEYINQLVTQDLSKQGFMKISETS